MQSGIINPDIFIPNPKILVFGMLAALASVGMWLQLASYFGWPVSTTHSIVGAIVGFGAVFGGMEAVYWKKVGYIVASWMVSPVLGGIIAYYIFTFLRKKIFYALNPLQETKRLTPLLVFIVTIILAIVFIFEGLHNLNLELSWSYKFILTTTIGLIGAFIGYLLVKRIPMIQAEIKPVLYDPKALLSLEKARKYLRRFRTKSSGEAQYTAGLLLEEIEVLSKSFESKIDTDQTHVEYDQVEKIFAYLQIITACMMAFAHGANDVANAIGPLSAAVAILTTGLFAIEAPVPTWALALGGSGIVVGLATWGWRVIETIGKKITELTPSRGFAAEFGAATTIVIASRLGLPISTTHTLVGAVLGVGFARGLEAVNLTTTRDILISWVVTVPIGALLAIILFYPIQAVFG
jgi:PiT family inorganic phosphate transporter